VPTAYIASPYGFSPATRGFHDGVLVPAVRAAGIEPLDPWADPDGSVAQALEDASSLPLGDERRAAFASIDKQLGIENEDALRRCDAMLAILDGADVDSGTAAEVGFAAALGKPVVGLRLDFRQSGDNEGNLVNLQVEHFCVAVTQDLDEAIRRLAEAVGVQQ
jgi:nucleoside 2-deoxyribosyltransferase